MVLRRAWKAGWWCTRQGARLGLWTTWLLLLVVAAGQIYFLSSRRIPVPKPLAQYVERHLATRGLHLSYARGLMDFTGRILLEGVRIASTSAPADPLASVRTLYLQLDVSDLLTGDLTLNEVRIEGLDLHVSAALSPSGVAEIPVGKINLSARPAGRDLELSYFTGYIGDLPVAMHGRFRLPPPSSTDTPADNSLSRLIASWPAHAARLHTFNAWLAAFDSPRIDLRLADGQLHVNARASSVNLAAIPGTTGGTLTGVRAHTTIPITFSPSTPVTLHGSIDILDFPLETTARGLVVQLTSTATLQTATLDAQLASVRWRDIETGPLAVSARQSAPRSFTADLSLALAGGAWRLQADVNDVAPRATLDGFITDPTLAFAGNLIQRDLSSLLDPAQPAPVHVEAVFDPRLKLRQVTGRLHSGSVLVGGAQLDETGTEFTYDGLRVLCDSLVLRQGDSLAHGNYEMDTRTQDFRFLLTGGLRPAGIDPWFKNWWSDFWKTFAFTQSPPVADVDVRGRWGDLTATRVFVRADGAQTGLLGVPFDHVSTRLFLRPHWFDILHFDVIRPDGSAGGALSRSLDLRQNTWTRMEFTVDSTLPLTVISQLFPDESTDLLAPYGFQTPPHLRLAGRVDSPSSPSGKHERIDIDLVSTGPMTYHDFPLSDLAFKALLRDDNIDLPALSVGFAGGLATGNARLRGPAESRRLSFDIALKKSNLGAVTRTLATLQPAPPAPDSEKSAESARLRQERLDRLNLDFTLAAEGRFADFRSFKGSGRADITGSELGQLNLFGPLSSALSGTLINLGSFSLDTVAAPFVLNADRIRFDDLRVTGPSALIQARGDYLLDGGTLDFTAKIHHFDENTSMLGSAFNFVLTPFSKVFEVKLQGTLSKPSWIFSYGPSRLLNTLSGGDKTQPSPAPDSSAP